jgi:hypothetical protein
LWPKITQRIAGDCIQKYADKGGQRPRKRWEIAPYASTVARIGEQERWLQALPVTKRDFDEAVDSFAVRPPSNSTRHVAALHFPARLTSTDGGMRSRLAASEDSADSEK